MVINVNGTTYSLVPDSSWSNETTDEIRIYCNTSVNPCTINLPLISSLGTSLPKIFIVDKSQNAAINNITINASTGNKIGSSSSEIITSNGGAVEIQLGDNTNWFSSSSSGMGGGGTIVQNLSFGSSPLSNWKQNSFSILSNASLFGIMGVMGDFTLSSRNYFSGLSVPDLNFNYGSVSVSGNTELESLRLNNLTQVGDITVKGGGIAPLSISMNPKLESINFPKLISSDKIFITSNDAAIDVKFDSLTTAIGANIDNCNLLEEISFASLVTCFSGSGSMTIDTLPELTNFNIPKLQTIYNELDFLDCPKLVFQSPELQYCQLLSLDNIGNVNLSIPKLIGFRKSAYDPSTPVVWNNVNGGVLTVKNNLLLKTISAPLFTGIFLDNFGSGMDITNNALLESVSLPLYINAQAVSGGVSIYNNPALTTITVATAGIICSVGNFSGNALNLSTVNAILASIDAGGESNGTLDLSGGTNASPTGGASNVNKLSLEAKGWTVSIN